MPKIKEIVVFSEQGDPRKLSTWSNVPYFLVSTLESIGIITHTENLNDLNVFYKTIEKLYNKIINIFYKDSFFSFNRTKLYKYIVNIYIKRAVKRYKNADAFIFTSFSLSANEFSSKPSILFCDWTIKYHIDYYLEREPLSYEFRSIMNQDNIIENADFVFVLFPISAQIMQNYYENKKIFYIGNVVNNLYEPIDFLSKKKDNNLLFVGTKKYINGAISLIKDFEKFKSLFPEAKLNIIGMDESDFNYLPSSVYCHGYLDKDNIHQRNKYYELLMSARIFINTSPKWGAFSASLEAMYFYTPIIVTPYSEFISTFGSCINFGFYSNNNSLLELIVKIVESEDYNMLCINAHNASKKFTWNNYVRNMLTIIEAN